MKENELQQFILGLADTLLADPNLVIQIALQNPDALQLAVLTFLQTQDMGQAAQAFQLALLKRSAKHGAKLNYIKSLKNKCADDEELVYFKRGGTIDCGCQKKETGGEVTLNDPISKFRKTRTGAKMKLEKGDKVCPKCGKIHKAGIGCAVANFRNKFLKGGNA